MSLPAFVTYARSQITASKILTNKYVREILVILGLWLIYFLPSLYQYLTFQLEWHDAGHVYRIIMNFWKDGQFTSYDWGRDHFNLHFTPFFYILTGLLRTIPHLLFFLSLNSLAMAVIVWLIFKMSKTISSHPYVPWLTSGLVLSNTYIWSTHLYPHFEVWGAFFLVAGAYALLEKNSRYFFLFLLILSLTVKTDMWFYALGVCWILYSREKKQTIFLAVTICLSYYILVIRGVYPVLYPERINLINNFWSFADNPLDIVWHYTSEVQPWISFVQNPYLWAFIGSFSGLFLLSPLRCIPLLSILMIWLSATEINRASLAYYYSTGAWLQVILILPFATHKLMNIFQRNKKNVLLAVFSPLILSVSLTQLWFPPKPLLISPHLSKTFSKTSIETQIDIQKHRIMRSIWQDSSIRSVFTQFGLAAYVPPDKSLWISFNRVKEFHNSSISPDLILLDITKKGIGAEPPAHTNHLIYHEMRQEYELIKHFEGMYIYKRRAKN